MTAPSQSDKADLTKWEIDRYIENGDYPSQMTGDRFRKIIGGMALSM